MSQIRRNLIFQQSYSEGRIPLTTSEKKYQALVLCGGVGVTAFTCEQMSLVISHYQGLYTD